MSVIILESDMQFGEYREDQVFPIEKSPQYMKSMKQNGVKTCEFILLRDNKLYFIEAKKSCPMYMKYNEPNEKAIKLEDYINDIIMKMRHSLQVYAAILLGRHETDGIPEPLQRRDLSDLEIRLVLVVKNAKKEWLVPFQEKFQKSLREELRIWKIPGFSVINEETAREKHFII